MMPQRLAQLRILNFHDKSQLQSYHALDGWAICLQMVSQTEQHYVLLFGLFLRSLFVNLDSCMRVFLLSSQSI